MDHFKTTFANQPNLKDKKFQEIDPELQENLIRSYVSTVLIDQEIKNKKIEDSKSYKEKLANIKKQVAQQEFLEFLISEAVTEQTLQAEYDTLSKNLKGKDEVKASHILFDNEEDAIKVRKKLENKKVSFAEMAKAHSKDDGTKAAGGSLGYFTSGQLVPEFENKAFSMKKGEISEPVKTQFGWHIIKFEDRKPVTVPSLAEAKPALKNKLGKEAVTQYIQNLIDKAEIDLKIKKADKKESN